MPSDLVRYFVFLEICDADICELLNELRSVFNQKKFKLGIHVTLRGPYVKPIDQNNLNEWFHKIKDSSILIANAGIFENEAESVVYLSVSTAQNSKNLSAITRKFDYPKNRFNFNPHVTLYAGKDKALARKIYEFLHKEQIELVCHTFELAVYASNLQAELFPEPRPPMHGEISSLISMRKISPEILVRARQLVEQHKHLD